MPAVPLLTQFIDIDTSLLSDEEILLFEAEVFVCICEELKNLFRNQHKDYFSLMKLTKEEEDFMLESKLVRLIINDIISTNEYSPSGIAYYTDTFEEVVEELIAGLNTNPSAKLFRKLIDLHRSVRRDLYEMITKKIASKYLNVV